EAAAAPPNHMPDRHRDTLQIPIVRNRLNLDDRPRGAVLFQVQAVFWSAAGHRAAEVDEIAVAVGAGADHRIGEGDRVRLPPGDLRAKSRAISGLIGSASEGRRAAKLE